MPKRAASHHLEIEVELNGVTYEVEADVTSGREGGFGGPPDRCSPPEAHEWKVTRVARVSHWLGQELEVLTADSWVESLTDEETDKLHDALGDALGNMLQTYQYDSATDEAYERYLEALSEPDRFEMDTF